jgi:hypothetical protein
MQEKIITTREEVTQVEDGAVGESKTNNCIARTMNEIQTTGQEIVQSYWNPREK